MVAQKKNISKNLNKNDSISVVDSKLNPIINDVADSSLNTDASLTVDSVVSSILDTPMLDTPMLDTPMLDTPMLDSAVVDSAPVVQKAGAKKVKQNTVKATKDAVLSTEPVLLSGASVTLAEDPKKVIKAKKVKGESVPKVKAESVPKVNADSVSKVNKTAKTAKTAKTIKTAKHNVIDYTNGEALLEANDIESDCKTRSFKVQLPEELEYTGRFTGLTPYQAANKALSKFFRNSDNTNISDNHIVFSIKESSRGSKRSTYTYKGTRIKLEKAITYTIKSATGEERVITKQYKNQLIKIKKGIVAETQPVVSVSV